MSTSQRASTAAWPGIKFSFRHHILPPLFGIVVMAVVYGGLNFPWVEAQSRYYWSHFHVPQISSSAPAVVAPAKDSAQLIIPSLGVKAPVIYEAAANNNLIEFDLRNGVVHYGTTAVPGQQGNVVIFGHSSGLAWAPGDYKFVFTLLEKLQPGQLISIDYQGTRYVYAVKSKQVVAPTDMSVLSSAPGQSELSLITCTPVGTSTNRLVVHATQLSPNPAKNQPFAPAVADHQAILPGN